MLLRAFWRRSRSAYLLGVLRAANKNICPAGARHRAAHQQQVFIAIHFHDFQILGRHIRIPHMTGKMLVLPNARWERTAANAARRAMKHRAVSCVAAAVVPALHAAREARSEEHTS